MDSNSRFAVFGGTILSSITHLGIVDIISTIILAIIGAIVSYITSLFVKYIHKRLQDKSKQ